MSAATGRPDRELAVLLSIATRIEPELMRAVRLTVAPRLDVAAETDLWFGGLVDRRSFGSISLREDLLPSLREDLGRRLAAAPPQSALHGLGDVTERVHRDLSPALRAEERAVWLAVRGGPDAEAGIEDSLRPALRALLVEGRTGIARWFAGAWERLPEEVRRTPAAWQLAAVSAARLPDGVPPPRPRRLTLHHVEIIAEHLPETLLHLVRTPTHLLLGEVRGRPGARAVRVPDSDPRVVDLITASGSRTLLIGAGETVETWVGDQGVRLVGGDGAVYEIPAPLGALFGLSGATGCRADLPDPAAESGPVTVISYAGSARPWAAWISQQLAQLGRAAVLRRWDPPADTQLAAELEQLLGDQDRALMVLDDAYFRLGGKTPEEWDAALREVVPPHADRFAAVSLSYGGLPAAVGLLRPADLRGLDENGARERLRRRLGVDSSDAPAVARDEGPLAAARYPDDPPAAWNAPRRNRRFTGRDALLEELNQRFTAAGDRRMCVLRGMSGVGKSQLAAEYAHRFGNDYDVTWWVSCTHRGAAREQLADLAGRLGLPVGPEIGARIRAVHDAVRTGRPHRRWLIVFDSADYREQIDDLVPDGRAHILITSLSRDWAEIAEEVEVRPFTRAESIAYISQRAPRLSPEEADDLAGAVQDLPLLVAQTAAWLDGNPLPPGEYIQVLRAGAPGTVGIRIDADYPMAFQTSWAITLNTLRERSPVVLFLLKLLAFFAPDDIPVHLLAESRPTDVPEPLTGVVADPLMWSTALRTLTESSAVRLTDRGRQGPGQTAQMHRLYHRFLRAELTEGELAELSEAACRVLASADPQVPADTARWERYAELIPHLEPSGALASQHPQVQELVVNCVEYLRVRGEHATGFQLCERALGAWNQMMAPTHPKVLVLSHQLANMLRRLGHYRKAEQVGGEIVARLAAERSPDSPTLLRAKDGLAGTLMALGAYERARQLFEEGWRSFAVSLGDRAPRTLSSRANHAIALGLLGRYEESLAAHRDVLEIRERDLGPRDPLTLNAATSHAQMLRLLGRYEEALSRQERNVALHRTVMGAHHPQTLRALHDLARCRWRSDGPDRPRMAELVRRCVRVHGAHHPETLMVRADEAMLLRRRGRLAEARERAESVAQGYLDLLGAGHPYTVGTRGNVGLVLQDIGDRDAALDHAVRAHRDMERAVGPDHPWTLGCAVNAANARSLVGQVVDAAELSGTTAQRAARTLGGTHPLSLASRTVAGPRRRSSGWDFEPQPI
ncbi:FxSxx-COOH system tetratricopeptide repeat protein [Streptomyces bugieae]|uniref:FxSxx-COOH system tetratricopeptide repeat protein n=1 Tax=Streptomyces bugieae TaxID=3098223 RepID=A0ABU7NZ07_9ACTN|nr:FxSxx-COOH system tetratricopeptide repeat protein [Streptomyces sp. DSM 41528]